MLGSTRAEITKLVRRPASWLLLAVAVVLSLTFTYLVPYAGANGAADGAPTATDRRREEAIGCRTRSRRPGARICHRSVAALSRGQAHREDQRPAVFGVGRVAAAQGTELLLPAAERPRHQARRTSHPPLEDEAVADTKKNCAKQGRTIVFIDESGVSERPHRVRTWAPRGKTPILQYSFTWNQLSAVAGVTFWNIYFKLVNGAVRAPELVAFLKNLRRHLRGRKLLIIWDRLQAHRSRLVRDYVDTEGGDIQLEFLPPYAPELNPVEYLWAHWKQHEMPNFCPRDFAELSAFARAKLKRTQRRKLLVAAFWKQADLPF